MVLAAGVALGAIASHAAGRAPHPDAARLLQTAVLYQLVHGVGIVLIGVLAGFGQSRWLALSGAAFLLGVALFCGSLYWLAFTAVSAGPLAPLGGASFIAGWIFLAIHALFGNRG
ncbi:MAG: DUF423 domain-containing protein [Betaproteobacteria bacterium]|nr:DUF423 domain-containing protein [Betaproteobacteria bacterium]